MTNTPTTAPVETKTPAPQPPAAVPPAAGPETKPEAAVDVSKK